MIQKQQYTYKDKKLSLLQNTIFSIINQSFDGVVGIPTEIMLEKPKDPSHGDWATNIALVLSKKVGKNPREIAESIKSELLTSKPESNPKLEFLKDLEIAGPGFINFRFKNETYFPIVSSIIKEGDSFGSGAVKKDQNVIVEFSSPNIAKPFTIGHLRSTVIGDSIARLLEFSGYTVFRDNHLGDWGAAFGKQLLAFDYFSPDLNEISNSVDPVKELVHLYIKINAEMERNPALKDEGRNWFKKLEEGDEKARALWEFCIDVSLKKFKAYYELLDIYFTENNGTGYGEAFFEEEMKIVLKKLDEAAETGILDYKKSEGAMLVFFSKESKLPPLMILKSNGTTLYSTRDLATDHFRMNKKEYGHPNLLVINEVGGEQKLYWRQIFAIEEALGWYKPGQRIHKGHGLFMFKEGKMSTRKGNVIWLQDVLDEAFKKVKEVSAEGLSDESIWKIAIGAIKWNDLKRDSNIDIIFDWDEVLNIKGNSGPYVQYTYTRCLSVLSKEDAKVESNKLVFALEEEIHVLKFLHEFSEVVKKSAEMYAPNVLAAYIYELAQRFNRFYNNVSILNADTSQQKQSRLALTAATAQILKNGLNLLGIKTVKRM